MGLFGFQTRPVSGPEILDFVVINSPKPLRNPLKIVGRYAPHHFKSVLKRLRQFEPQQSAISGTETGRI